MLAAGCGAPCGGFAISGDKLKTLSVAYAGAAGMAPCQSWRPMASTATAIVVLALLALHLGPVSAVPIGAGRRNRRTTSSSTLSSQLMSAIMPYRRAATLKAAARRNAAVAKTLSTVYTTGPPPGWVFVSPQVGWRKVQQQQQQQPTSGRLLLEEGAGANGAGVVQGAGALGQRRLQQLQEGSGAGMGLEQEHM
jgi:hypothetical protein